MFVIARNAIRFSRDDSYDERAAWGIWASVVRHGDHTAEYPLRHLWQELKKDRPIAEAPSPYTKAFSFPDLEVDLIVS